jgi:DNA-binding GntR family transcriptional regulator
MSKLALRTMQRSPPLAQQIYASLRLQLRSGVFAMGDRLVDANLARLLEVSRSPVREALSRLAADGLLETDEGGFRVPLPTRETTREICDVRRLIEPPAAKRACGVMTPQALTLLTEALEDAKAAADAGDYHRFLSGNYDFRSAWVGCVPNSRLRETILRFDDQAGQIRRMTFILPEARDDALRIMSDWTDAFKARDENKAAAMALAFIDAAERYFGKVAEMPAAVIPQRAET